MAKRKTGTEVIVKLFEFEGIDVRITDQNGAPWFVLADVCRVLDHSNPTMAAQALDDDEKAALNITETSSNGVTQRRKMVVINESGLYNLILASRKPEAKRFRKWITSTVLPTLRETGTYTVGKESAREHVRKEGKVVRKEFTATLYAHGVRKHDEFRHVTNAVYHGLYGTDAAGLRERNSLPAKANIRDHMSPVGLASVMLAEVLASDRIVAKNDYGVVECARSTKACAEAVKVAILEERRTRRIVSP